VRFSESIFEEVDVLVKSFERITGIKPIKSDYDAVFINLLRLKLGLDPDTSRSLQRCKHRDRKKEVSNEVRI